MQLFHFYHQNKLQKLIHSDFWLFEFSVWLHTFARSMVAIFIPIFFLTIGYEIGMIMVYYLLYNAFDVPLNFLARYLTRKYGARIVIILGSLSSVAFFITLYELELGNLLLFILISFFAAIYDSFFWVAHLFLFLKCSDKDDDVSEDASILDIVRRLAGIVAPAIGAMILVYYDKNLLIIISTTVLLISIIPLFLLKNLKDIPRRKQKSIKKFFDSWDVIRDYVVSFFMAINNTAESIIWPLFIYIFFKNIESVAVIPIIVSVTAIIFTYLTGKKATKERRNSLMSIGGIMIALVWVVRIFYESNIFYYVSIFLVGLFSVLITIPLNSNVFEKGEKRDTLSASTYRNATHMFANFIFFSVMALLVNVFNVSFLIASVCMLLLVAVSYFLSEDVLLRKRSIWGRVFKRKF